MTSPIKQYLPVLGMVLAAVLNVLYVAYADNTITLYEGLNLILAVLGAVTLYVVPRAPGVLWLKPAVAAATAALMVVVDAVASSGINSQTWIMAGIQALVGLGIVAATNKNVPLTQPLPKAA
jgi:hypothetical protein